MPSLWEYYVYNMFPMYKITSDLLYCNDTNTFQFDDAVRYCTDKTIMWLSYLHEGFSHTFKTTYSYWNISLSNFVFRMYPDQRSW